MNNRMTFLEPLLPRNRSVRARAGLFGASATALLLALPLALTPLSGCTGEPEPAPEPEPSAEPEVSPEVDAGQPEPGPPPIDAGPTDGDTVVNVDNGDGTTSTVVAATGREPIYFSFATQAEVLPDDPLASNEWDLGFLRFNVGVNGGGYFGNAGGAVAPMPDTVTFAAITEAPADGYLTDLEDDDLDGNPEFIMGDETLNPWYAYDEITHVLTATENVYVIRTDRGDYYAMVYTAYYNDDGLAGYVAFDWKAIDPPGGSPVDGGPADGGDDVDAGTETDAGTDADAGTDSDAGSDAGTSADAG